jgi:SAM-dependent methyltransferase
MAFKAEIAESLKRMNGLLSPSGAKILDVGCGTKTYSGIFSNHQYIGIDVEQSGRDESGKKPDAYFDGRTIPYPDNHFDLIVCTEVLEHATDATYLVKEMHRCIRPGGHVFITVPFMWGEHEMPYDFRRYTSEGITKALNTSGFTNIEVQKTVLGVNALTSLIKSEMVNFEYVRFGGRSTLFRRILKKGFLVLWYGYAALLKKFYNFERIYIRNIAFGTKA